jgi:hypothetical protein
MTPARRAIPQPGPERSLLMTPARRVIPCPDVNGAFW